jgi:hypothetical protein
MFRHVDEKTVKSQPDWPGWAAGIIVTAIALAVAGIILACAYAWILDILE